MRASTTGLRRACIQKKGNRRKEEVKLLSIVRACQLCALAVVCVGGVQAQDCPSADHLSVPFSFYDGTSTLPAGDHILNTAVPSFLELHSKDGKVSGSVSLLLYGDAVSPSDTHLVFAEREGQWMLRELWSPQGRFVVSSHFGQQGSHDEEIRNVPLSVAP
jgi:hypothetical protein